MKSKIIKNLLLSAVSIALISCAYPYKGEYSIDNSSNSILLQGESWHTAEALWSFQDNSVLEIKTGDNQAIKGYWYHNDEKLEIMINDITTVYDLVIVNDNKIQLNHGERLIVLQK